MTLPHYSTRARWALIVAVALAATLPYVLKIAGDHDLWWHVKTGQLIVEQRTLPDTDPFSFTAAGAPWTHHEWLSDVVLWCIYTRTGDRGLSLLGFGFLLALVTGLAALLWRRLPHPVFVLTGCLVATPLIKILINLRPHSYTYLFVVLLVLLLEAAVTRPRLLWLAPPLMALWVNLHGGFILGLGILGLGLASRWFGLDENARPANRNERRALLGVLGTSLLAPLLNPYGVGLIPYLARELGADHSLITEWNGIWAFPAHRLTFVLLVLTPAALLAASRRMRPLMPVLLLAISTIATYRHARFLIVLVIFSALVTFSCLSELLRRSTRDGSGKLLARLAAPRWAWIACSVPLVAALAQFTVDLSREGLRLKNPWHVPVQACEFLQRHELGPNLLLRLDWGGYAIWHLYPSYRVSGDGRNLTVYGEEFVSELLEAYDDGSFGDYAGRLDVDVILSESAGPTFEALRSDPGWVPVHRDRIATVFVRPEVARAIPARRDGSPEIQPASERIYFP